MHAASWQKGKQGHTGASWQLSWPRSLVNRAQVTGTTVQRGGSINQSPPSIRFAKWFRPQGAFQCRLVLRDLQDKHHCQTTPVMQLSSVASACSTPSAPREGRRTTRAGACDGGGLGARQLVGSQIGRLGGMAEA